MPSVFRTIRLSKDECDLLAAVLHEHALHVRETASPGDEPEKEIIVLDSIMRRLGSALRIDAEGNVRGWSWVKA